MNKPTSRQLFSVTFVTENILSGKVQTSQGYRARSKRQVEQLTRKLSKVYETYNERIIDVVTSETE